MIKGIITTRDVLSHPVLIAQSFGFGVLFAAIAALVCRRRTTFLELAWGRS